VNRPSDEANALYIEQSNLAARLLVHPNTPLADEQKILELIIWDVGLGAASNAMAAINPFEKLYALEGPSALRPLRIISFECDLDPLTLATKKSARFPHLQHGAPHALLANGRWTHASNLLSWELVKGDFSDHFPSAPAPDLIFYDPFSSKIDTALWTSAVFTRIFAHCQPKPVELYTYSAATAVRVALLTAEFFVAEGVGTGPKATQ